MLDPWKGIRLGWFLAISSLGIAGVVVLVGAVSGWPFGLPLARVAIFVGLGAMLLYPVMFVLTVRFGFRARLEELGMFRTLQFWRTG
jgi:hypothetical protein